MDDNLAIFLILAIAINAALILTISMSWIRTKRRALELQPAAVTTLKNENETLKAQVAKLESRLHVLERIAVDPAERTSREIELLR
ncbi:hypothetical protein E2493_05635 [Sphingomonas parva]|uniref:Uncharacterized protein n=1 Tax=Sphingomonas parva TaxID=2555898 RepID=A0A4Y8ZTH4_9SPHN|nr:hypothetical protein [Sphingomonas parva]TFI59320.1 hypothetical protein E2493_05635 [Sphingomonas parva]